MFPIFPVYALKGDLRIQSPKDLQEQMRCIGLPSSEEFDSVFDPSFQDLF